MDKYEEAKQKAIKVLEMMLILQTANENDKDRLYWKGEVHAVEVVLYDVFSMSGKEIRNIINKVEEGDYNGRD